MYKVQRTAPNLTAVSHVVTLKCNYHLYSEGMNPYRFIFVEFYSKVIVPIAIGIIPSLHVK